MLSLWHRCGVTVPLWLTVVGATVAITSAACPSEEWLLNEDYCYWVTPIKVDWKGADVVCYDKHPEARAVSIHDMIENAFVAERFEHSSPWIGLFRFNTNSEWAWTDGTPVNFTNWCQGYPAGDGQRFAYIPPGVNGCWHSYDFTGYVRTVCKTRSI